MFRSLKLNVRLRKWLWTRREFKSLNVKQTERNVERKIEVIIIKIVHAVSLISERILFLNSRLFTSFVISVGSGRFQHYTHSGSVFK